MRRAMPKTSVETERQENFRKVSTDDVRQGELSFGTIRLSNVDEREESYGALKRDICTSIEMIGGNKVFATATGRSVSDVSRACNGNEGRAMPVEFLDDLTVNRPAFEYTINRWLRRHGYGPLRPIPVATPEEKYEALRRAVESCGIGKEAILEEAARIGGVDVETFE